MSKALEKGALITIVNDGKLTLTKIDYVHRGSPTFRTIGGRHSFTIELENEGITWMRGWDLNEAERSALLAAHALTSEPF